MTQSTVFERMKNTRVDAEQSPERLRMKHAPKRFLRERSSITGLTTLRFGSGNENVFDEDVIPDPSDHAIRLFGDKKTVNKLTIDPNSFVRSCKTRGQVHCQGRQRLLTCSGIILRVILIGTED